MPRGQPGLPRIGARHKRWVARNDGSPVFNRVSSLTAAASREAFTARVDVDSSSTNTDNGTARPDRAVGISAHGCAISVPSISAVYDIGSGRAEGRLCLRYGGTFASKPSTR